MVTSLAINLLLIYVLINCLLIVCVNHVLKLFLWFLPRSYKGVTCSFWADCSLHLYWCVFVNFWWCICLYYNKFSWLLMYFLQVIVGMYFMHMRYSLMNVAFWFSLFDWEGGEEGLRWIANMSYRGFNLAIKNPLHPLISCGESFCQGWSLAVVLYREKDVSIESARLVFWNFPIQTSQILLIVSFVRGLLLIAIFASLLFIGRVC